MPARCKQPWTNRLKKHGRRLLLLVTQGNTSQSGTLQYAKISPLDQRAPTTHVQKTLQLPDARRHKRDVRVVAQRLLGRDRGGYEPQLPQPLGEDAKVCEAPPDDPRAPAAVVMDRGCTAWSRAEVVPHGHGRRLYCMVTGGGCTARSCT
jgi:hypothetical protein